MKITSMIILVLIVISCSNNKEKQLTERVNSLEFENSELKEKIESLEELSLINTVMKPSFDKAEYAPNGKGKITFQAHKYGNFLFDYDVVENLQNEKKGKVIMKKLSDSKFEYSFDLSKMESNRINLSMIFQVNNKVFEIPTKAEIKIRN
jgi:uncharacterized protein YcfL